jgi:hypothetical protein
MSHSPPIPLASLGGSSSAASPTPSPSSTPATSQPCAAVSLQPHMQSAQQPAAGPATPSSASPTAIAASPAKTPFQSLVNRCRSLLPWLTWITKILLATLGIVATYIAVSLALWTSEKDFRDDCRSQNVTTRQFFGDLADPEQSTLGFLTKKCRSALAKPLSDPPLSGWLYERAKRWLQKAAPMSQGAPNVTELLLLAAFAVAGLLVCGIILITRYNNRRHLNYSLDRERLAPVTFGHSLRPSSQTDNSRRLNYSQDREIVASFTFGHVLGLSGPTVEIPKQLRMVATSGAPAPRFLRSSLRYRTGYSETHDQVSGRKAN